MELPQELDEFLFANDLSKYRTMVVEELIELNRLEVELLLLSIRIDNDALYLESLTYNEQKEKLEYYNNALLVSYLKVFYSEYYENYTKKLPNSRLHITINIEFDKDAVIDYMLTVEERAEHARANLG